MKAIVRYVVDGTTTTEKIIGHSISVQMWNKNAPAGDHAAPALVMAFDKCGKRIRRFHVARCWFVDVTS